MTLEDRAAVILTPEHVPVQLFPAGAGIRFLALMIDTLVLWFTSILILIILGIIIRGGMGLAVWLTLNFLLQWGYHIYFELRHQGRSIGKRMMGLRVVDGRGLPITFQQSFIRNICRAFDALPVFYGVGGLFCLFDPLQRRGGDLLADTLVIRDRKAMDTGGITADARRFNSLRTPGVLRRIRHRVSLEQREFLTTLCIRADRLNPKARFDLMEEVGAYYREILEVDDPHLSGENLVRGVTAILFAERS